MLTRLFGKQTWEYSPEFAIRSYAYLIPYSLLSYPISWVKYILQMYNVYDLHVPTYTLFYVVRVILALSFSLAEIKLSKTLKFFNKNIQNWFLVAQILSPGMYQASISILPSSFSLLFGILSTNYIVNYFNIEKLISTIDTELLTLENKANTTSKDSDADELAPRTNMLLNLYRVSIPLITKSFTMVALLTSIGGCTGWPFSMILISPFILYSLLESLIRSPKSVLKNYHSVVKTFGIYLLSGASCLFFIAYFISQLDSLFYKKVTYVAFNIMSYNIFNTDELSGPHIFGVESPDWYVKNLLLNFHVFFVIALLNFLTIFNRYQLVIYKLPLLIWFAILTSQPHKEERFMYPIYHLISISFAQFMSCETFNSCSIMKLFKKLLNCTVLLLTTILFLTRINNLNSNYSAPINVLKYLSDSTSNFSPVPENICMGREWYHYPSSLFLNDNQRLRFTQSSFDGMLPGDFLEPRVNSFEGLVNATSHIPQGFNNMNKFNPDFITSTDECTYYIDIDKEISENDATSILDAEKWEIMYCQDILDVDNSDGIERVLDINNFLERFIIDPWLNLQKDLSVIELNRKLMEMYGIQDAVGTQMFDGLYIKLNSLKNLVNDKFGDYMGTARTNKFCVARRK